jgi:hypothetical protein
MFYIRQIFTNREKEDLLGIKIPLKKSALVELEKALFRKNIILIQNLPGSYTTVAAKFKTFCSTKMFQTFRRTNRGYK